MKATKWILWALGAYTLVAAVSEAARPRPGRAVLIYDGGCGLCRRAARLSRRIAGHGRLTLLDVRDRSRVSRLGVDPDDANEHVTLHTARDDRTGYDAAAEVVCMRSRWLCPLLLLWPVRLAGRLGYALVSPRRYQISRALGWE
jgi:predicted DCC family thiol-disulfide oxidoreductase YuxK